jgi:hypothetical protein
VALVSLAAIGFHRHPIQPFRQDKQGPKGAGMVGFALAMFGEEFHGGGRLNADLF